MEVGVMAMTIVEALSLPGWIRRLDTAIWISDETQRLVHCNEAGSRLLGRPLGAVEDLPCYRVVNGRRVGGGPWCRKGCPVWRAAMAGREVAPFRLVVEGLVTHPTVSVVPIVLPADEGHGQLLVHAAFESPAVGREILYLGAEIWLG
jgi:hypothetical protein